jgi:hypothetical protein
MKGSPLVARILGILAATEPQELGCGEVFALLDEFAEKQAAGEDLSGYARLLKHLEMCGECREEYEALLSMVTMPGG